MKIIKDFREVFEYRFSITNQIDIDKELDAVQKEHTDNITKLIEIKKPHSIKNEVFY